MTQDFFNKLDFTDKEVDFMRFDLENNIKYFVREEDNELLCLHKESLLKCIGDYYDYYDDIPINIRNKNDRL